MSVSLVSPGIELPAPSNNEMEDCVIIVDNSNIWIEGMKLSVVQKGMCAALDGKTPCDYSWRIDFGKLLNLVAEGKNP